jgi:hypothetical protein
MQSPPVLSSAVSAKQAHRPRHVADGRNSPGPHQDPRKRRAKCHCAGRMLFAIPPSSSSGTQGAASAKQQQLCALRRQRVTAGGATQGVLCHIVSAIGKGKSFDRIYLLNSIWVDDSPIHSRMYREFQTLLCAKGFEALMARQDQQRAITQSRRAEAPLSCVLGMMFPAITPADPAGQFKSTAGLN